MQSLTTRVGSDLGVLSAPGQEGKPVPSTLRPSGGRELGQFGVLWDRTTLVPFSAVLPGLWPSLPKSAPAHGSQLPFFTHSPQAVGRDRAISWVGKLRYGRRGCDDVSQ